MRPARNYQYLPYHNDVEGDCVGSSYGHCVHAMTGSPPTDADQQKMVRATNDMNGTQVGWYMWRMLFRSLDHFRQHTFGSIGTSQAQAQWAINRYGAVMICVDGGGHEVAGIDYDADNIYVVAHTIAGQVQPIAWKDYPNVVFQRGSFAFTSKFDPLLLANAWLHNWVWPLTTLIAMTLGLYFGGVI